MTARALKWQTSLAHPARFSSTWSQRRAGHRQRPRGMSHETSKAVAARALARRVSATATVDSGTGLGDGRPGGNAGRDVFRDRRRQHSVCAAGSRIIDGDQHFFRLLEQADLWDGLSGIRELSIALRRARWQRASAPRRRPEEGRESATLPIVDKRPAAVDAVAGRDPFEPLGVSVSSVGVVDRSPVLGVGRSVPNGMAINDRTPGRGGNENARRRRRPLRDLPLAPRH